MKLKYQFLSIVILLVLSMFVISGKVIAAQKPIGITVSPAFQQITINPSAELQPVSFIITNNESAQQNLHFSFQDFSTLNDTGGLFFVGTNPTSLQKKYGLAKWMVLPSNSIDLKPKQTIKIEASILNLPEIQAGGHYGALMVSIGDQNSTAKNSNIGIQPIASSLLFVTKPNGATHKLNLVNVSFKNSIITLPNTVSLKFENVGNTHIVPRGIVTITKAGSNGTIYSKGILNQDSKIILPQSFRQYSLKLNKLVIPRVPGKYILQIDFRFDGISQFRTYHKSIVNIPIIFLIISAIISLVAIIGVLLKLFRSQIKHYK